MDGMEQFSADHVVGQLDAISVKTHHKFRYTESVTQHSIQFLHSIISSWRITIIRNLILSSLCLIFYAVLRIVDILNT